LLIQVSDLNKKMKDTFVPVLSDLNCGGNNRVGVLYLCLSLEDEIVKK